MSLVGLVVLSGAIAAAFLVLAVVLLDLLARR